MPASFCCCSTCAAFVQSDGVDVDGSMPRCSRPILPSSVLSLIMPTWPASAGSQRSARLSGSRPSAWVALGLYAMPVKPDCHTTEYLFPGSYEGLLIESLAYFVKLGSWLRSSGISQLLPINSDSWAPLVITMMSQPVD